MLIGITGHKGVLGNIIRKILDEKGISYSCFDGNIINASDIDHWLQQNHPTHIIHFAAVVATNVVADNLKNAYFVNVKGTENLIVALAKHTIKPWFFYASSSHVYKSSNKPISEDGQIEPINSYGMTKYFGEVAAEKLSKEMGLDLCIGRIFSFYHASQSIPFLYPSILKRLKEEDLSKPFFLHRATSIRDFSNAEDICRLIIKLLEKRSTGCFNIGSGKGITIRDFVQLQTETPIIFQTDPNELEQYLVANISKLKKEIGE